MSDDVVRDALAELLALQTQLVPLPTATGYGVDLVCFDDLTQNLDETDPVSVQSLAQDNYHRLCTQQGTLPDDLDYGKDLTEYLSKGTGVRELLALQGDIETELKKDDRNAEISAQVVVTSLLPCKLTITIAVTPADPDLQPFKLIIAVDASGVFLEAIQ